ncbi:MAG: pyrroline-5-carboxylate reductase [Clostridia bacterium]|nr:pyrroline-5-carboxylate reductase [Clostridia bacterium]
MKYKLGFIGCGNMGGALVKAAAKTVQAETIAVCDHNENKTTALQSELGVCPVSIRELAQESKFIVLGVKPQRMQETLSEIADVVQERTNVTLVTMAAGLSIAAIRSFVGADAPVIRIMPNTPVTLGEGMTLYACEDVSKADKKEFLHCFEKAGVFDKISEDKIDAASALSGCGPAYVYSFAEALANGAVECGVEKEKADLYAAQTLLGAAKMLLAFGNPSDLIAAVCSPGGTTIAGMQALEKAGFKNATLAAVHAAYQRTLELKK